MWRRIHAAINGVHRPPRRASQSNSGGKRPLLPTPYLCHSRLPFTQHPVFVGWISSPECDNGIYEDSESAIKSSPADFHDADLLARRPHSGQIAITIMIRKEKKEEKRMDYKTSHFHVAA